MKTPTSGDAARHREFEVERWPAHARVMRAAAVVAMVLIPMGGLTDYAIAGATATTYTLVALRLVTSAIHMPIFMACRRSRPSPTLGFWIGLGFVATAISGILGPTLLRPTSVASQGGPLLLILVLWSLLFPAWRRHKSTIFMLVSAVYVAIGFYWRGVNDYGGKHELITMSIFLVALGLLLPKVYARFEATEFRLFRAQKGLERTVIQLENEVELRRERELALREAREQALAASAAKGEFLANVSHELRTPLVGILGISELLLDARLGDGERERVEILQRSGQLLLGLVNDLLDFSKLEAGRLPLERVAVSIPTVCRHVIDLLGARAVEKGIWLRLEVSAQAPEWVETDPLRVEQILLNLVGNALRFTDKGGVLLRVEVESSDRIRLIVKDTGVGIGVADLERIFKPFEQAAASTARNFGGTGLGLSITQRLVARLDGEITVDSTVGVGTKFEVVIGAQPTQPPADLRAPTGGFGVAMRILLGEDNPVNALVITALLRSMGHHVDLASDGQALIQAAGSERFDLILTDIQMPELDGAEAARRIRESVPMADNTPILALTADVSRRSQKTGYFDAVLPKPIARHELQKVLQQFANPAGHVPKTSTAATG